MMNSKLTTTQHVKARMRAEITETIAYAVQNKIECGSIVTSNGDCMRFNFTYRTNGSLKAAEFFTVKGVVVLETTNQAWATGYLMNIFGYAGVAKDDAADFNQVYRNAF